MGAEDPMLHGLLDNIAVLLILLAIGLLLSIRQWPEWWRRARSGSWPTTPAIIESGEVSTVRHIRRYSRADEIATAQLAYSYQLDGTYYSGYHTETFNDEQKAWLYVDALKGKSVSVSYNPRNPAVSVLRRQQVFSA